MNKPSIFTFMVGNNFGISCMAAVSVYLLLVLGQTGSVDPVALIGCLSLTWVAWISRRSAYEYRHGGRTLAKRMGLFMAGCVWVGTVLWTSQNPGARGTDPYDISLMLWAIASLAFIFWALGLLRRIACRIRHAILSRPAKPVHYVVAQCLRVPSQSPKPQQIIAALPEYAVKCLEQVR